MHAPVGREGEPEEPDGDEDAPDLSHAQTEFRGRVTVRGLVLAEFPMARGR